MELKELFEKIKEKENVQNKINHLENDITTLSEEVELYFKEMEKEKKDVDNLENGYIRSYFLELMGTYDKKLNQEKQEAYKALTRYQSAKYQLDILQNEIKNYKKKLHEINKIESTYLTLFQDKLSLLRKTQIDLVNKEEEIAKSKTLLNEIKEALNACLLCLEKANLVKKELVNADGWATWDLFSDGFISNVMKYNHINKAEKNILDLQCHLSIFKTELSDVRISSELHIDISEFLRFADYFFDNIFTDYSVLNKISNSTKLIEKTIDELQLLKNDLLNLQHNEKMNLEDLNKQLEKMVVYKEA